MTGLAASALARTLILVAIAAGLAVTASLLKARAARRVPAITRELVSPPDLGRVGLDFPGWLLFTSTTCAPCKKVRDALEDSGVPWAPVDVDEHPDLFRRLSVYRVPTLVWIDDSGEAAERHGPHTALKAATAQQTLAG